MCQECKGHSGAHYVWCALVGGPGFHPSSTKGLIARMLAAQQAQAQAEAEERERQQSNNGWVRYPRERAPEPLPFDGVKAEHPAFVTASSPTKERIRYAGQKPGREVPAEVREVIRPLLAQGWAYRKNNASGRGKPRVVSPQGQTYTLANTPSDWRHLQNLRADLRKLGAAI